MTNPVTTPAPSQDTPTTLQREALHDLLNLARDCSQAQSQADSKHVAQNKSIEDRRKRVTARILRMYEQRAREIQAKAVADRAKAEDALRESLDLAGARHVADMKAFQQKTEKERAKLQTQIRDEMGDFDGLWEAFKRNSQKTVGESKERLQERREQVGAMQAGVDKRLVRMTGQPGTWPGINPDAAPGDYDAAVSAMNEQCNALEQATGSTWCDNGGKWVAIALSALGAGGVVFLGVMVSGTQWKVAGVPAMAIGAAAACLSAAAAGAVVFAMAKSSMAKRQREITQKIAPALASVAEARDIAEAIHRTLVAEQAAAVEAAGLQHDQDVTSAKQRFAPMTAKLEAEIARRNAEIVANQNKQVQDARAIHSGRQVLCNSNESTAMGLRMEGRLLLKRMEKGIANRLARVADDRTAALTSAKARWEDGCARIQRMIKQLAEMDAPEVWEWESARWDAWKPPHVTATTYRFGKLRLEGQVAGSIDGFSLNLPKGLAVPALIPAAGSLFLEHDAEGRTQALDLLRSALGRLLVSVPPGSVRLTMIDPVGLGEGFAGFMHLSESEVDLVGGRIWTAPEDIDRKLGDLTDHMENVIQKYLRNAYNTIEQYNTQAGELAEPYRVLVVSDFPAGFTQMSLEKLAAIAQTGARCGVHILMACDSRQGTLPEALRDALRQSSTQGGAWLQCMDGKITWKDTLFGKFPFLPDGMPEEKRLTGLLGKVAREAARFQRVEVNFNTITPKENEIWSLSAASGLRIPVGRSGVSRIQEFDLGRGTRQHALVAGKTGSGKSSFLNAVITNLAMWYAPDEAQVLLIDFKKGIEFKAYAKHKLPHAQAVAIESDLEFGVSVLRRLDAEMERRGDAFRLVGAQDLKSYREMAPKGETKLPRLLLVIDEFQEFFTRDDKISQDAGMLLDRIARQGRAFGVHMLLGSQTLGGGSSIPRSTLGQMAVRIALQCDEADAQLILSDTNTAARLLSRPGEAIYNDAAGRVEANAPFQVAWLPDDQRDEALERVAAKTKAMGLVNHGPIVFEGGAVADPADNPALAAILSEPQVSAPVKIKLWLGLPVAIKEATFTVFGRQAGDNLLVVGPVEESATGVIASALLGAMAQLPNDGAGVTLLDGTPEDSPMYGALARTLGVLPHPVTFAAMRQIDEALSVVHAEVRRRVESNDFSSPRHLLVIHGLQRYRGLRKSESGYSFSMDGPADKPPAADKMMADIVKDGSSVGIHTILWADSYATFDRCFERNMLREFDHRLFFQISAGDSSNLMDATDASNLGANRALLFSEERGVKEKCLPYCVPRESWLASLGKK